MKLFAALAACTWISLASVVGQIPLPFGGSSSVSPEKTIQIQRCSAELLSRYAKLQKGNLLSHMKSGSSELWVESRDLTLSRVSPHVVTTTDRANGIEAIHMVRLDATMHRTYDPRTKKWTNWQNGRCLLLPTHIHVNQKRDGQLVAESSMLSRFTAFTLRGNPDLIPCVQERGAPKPAPLLQIPLHQSEPTPTKHKMQARPNPIEKPGHEIVKKTLHPFLAALLLLLGFLTLLILTIVLGSARYKGAMGERAVTKGLAGLDPASYHVFHDIYLARPDGQGSTQLDHVVVSPYGIFVIETKNYRGWIFGSEKQREWTQQIYRKKSRFQNPLHQNDLHVRALMQCLQLPREAFLPVVFFIGNTTFKTPMPSHVLNHGLASWILAHQVIRLKPNELEKATATLGHIDQSIDRRTAAKAHVSAIYERRASRQRSPKKAGSNPPPLPVIDRSNN